MEIVVSRLMFVRATLSLVLFMYKEILLFSLAANSIKRICASGLFVRMVNNYCTPNNDNYVSAI